MKSGSIRAGKYFRVIVFGLLGFLLIAATEKKAGKVEFNFRETSKYAGELDKRPDFPVAVTFLRNYVYSVPALGESIDAKNKDKIIAFTKKIQRADGGFSIDPATKWTSSLYTDFALESLSYINSLNSIDDAKARAYLVSLKRPDSGFSFDAKIKEPSSLPATYYAVHSLSLLKGLGAVDKTMTAAYVKGFEKKDTGGFSSVKGTGAADPKETYMAIYVLQALGRLDETTKKNTIKFLASTPYVTPRKYEISQTLEEQAYTIMALKILGAGSMIRKDTAVAFIKSFYIPVNGGFGPLHGYGTAPDPTYYGIRCLAELGVLKMPVQSRLK